MSARHTFNLELRGHKFTVQAKQGRDAALFDAFMRGTLGLEKFATEAVALLRAVADISNLHPCDGPETCPVERARAFLARLAPPPEQAPKLILSPDENGAP